MKIAEVSLPDRPVGGPLLLRRPARRAKAPPIGQILIELGELSPADLLKAAAIRAREDVLFGEILLANNMVSEVGLHRGLAQQFGCDLVDIFAAPPDIRLLEKVDPAFCIQHSVIPYKRIGAITLIATSRPDNFASQNENFPASFGQTLMVVAPESAIQTTLANTCHRALAMRAESRVADAQSCRNWNSRAPKIIAALLAMALMSVTILWPLQVLTLLTAWAITALVFNTGLKAAAAWTTYRSTQASAVNFTTRRGQQPMMRLPKISVLVPLYQEREIAGRLVKRLGRLSYPRELLDICLVVEQDDHVTQAALAAANLPRWMRQITVPRAALKTKPRALNYALDFCRGSIIGVYDAEDAPEADQLFKVARRFHEYGPEVACLQGVLDFYNPRTNWLSRCFTIEYATWFRMVLPGLERLGFVIPLGGTTIFFRRKALEEIGAWDAHNVTEDADLGIRLARRGYQTKLIATVTREEANCSLWPWIRQRQSPGRCICATRGCCCPNWGPGGFLACKSCFWAPCPISCWHRFSGRSGRWALPLGITHPLQSTLSPTVFYLITGLFFVSELVSLAVGVFALAPARHRWLWLWVPTLHFYFPLAALAAYKGIWELVSKPFYWDKTAHGQNSGANKTG